MMKEKIIVFDTETGGTEPTEDALLSLGAIAVDENLNRYPGENLYFVMRNDNHRAISDYALTEVNKLTMKEIEGGIPLTEGQEYWKKFIAGATGFIAHNVAFDSQMLLANGFEFPALDEERTLCTMQLGWDLWGRYDENEQWVSMKLKDCMVRIGEKEENAHHALGDCEMTLKLLHHYLNVGHISLPLKFYRVFTNYYNTKTFGYKQIFAYIEKVSKRGNK